MYSITMECDPFCSLVQCELTETKMRHSRLVLFKCAQIFLPGICKFSCSLENVKSFLHYLVLQMCVHIFLACFASQRFTFLLQLYLLVLSRCTSLLCSACSLALDTHRWPAILHNCTLVQCFTLSHTANKMDWA